VLAVAQEAVAVSGGAVRAGWFGMANGARRAGASERQAVTGWMATEAVAMRIVGGLRRNPPVANLAAGGRDHAPGVCRMAGCAGLVILR